ncbi:hypothetical protein Cgig2_025599 [Carnegiea gigantea]|uniref:TF-B3 domain-containing protein n=1 Tax=Carnegiea gigantea TaxID=171969 RepID=A0A9Q1JV38_9CARY|nr:hypothetical protein Cgig2_025599 [Carnegiea gigantea]
MWCALGLQLKQCGKLIWQEKNNGAWLQNGWPEFVKFYSICHGHFLVFRYEGHSHFEVFILDVSASEIEFSLWPEDEIAKKVSEMPNLVVGRNCLLTVEDAKKVEDCQCEHPSFVIKTVPSHVEFKYNVNLPVEFVRKYLEECGMFTFETGKTWLVRCTDTAKGEKKSVTFDTGWRDFAQDDTLRVGDIRIFELIKGENKLFKVNILPVAREKAGNYPRVKVTVVPGCVLSAILGIVVDLPLITAITVCKTPVLLFKVEVLDVNLELLRTRPRYHDLVDADQELLPVNELYQQHETGEPLIMAAAIDKGNTLTAKVVRTCKQISKPGSTQENKIVYTGIPAYACLECFLRSIKSGSPGFVLCSKTQLLGFDGDDVEITRVNTPEGRIFDWLYEPMCHERAD